MIRHPNPIDWSKVEEAHVKDACSRYDSGDRRPKVAAKNTFLLLDDKRYPAKFIRGLAYELATGHELSSDDYSGGAETVRFFEALGFLVEYNREVRDVKNKPNSDQKFIEKEEEYFSAETFRATIWVCYDRSQI